MRVLITGICGFVGSEIALFLKEHCSDLEIVGIDNLIRRGSELNVARLEAIGTRVLHGDIRMASDLEGIGRCDFVIDAAANASVLAGVDGESSSRQLLEHNLGGTINLLEFCKRCQAGFILLSTSRVYSIQPLAKLSVTIENGAYRPESNQVWPAGLSANGISESFSTAPPVSLYGATKVASETLALEYGSAFQFPVFINRCGVMAGAGQFGRADQGIFSYWIRAYQQRRPLGYIGFGGTGAQVRDAFHPRDLARLLSQQIQMTSTALEFPVMNLGGGRENAMSLRQLSDWCAERFGEHSIDSDERSRRFDLPWVVMDSALAAKAWDWQPEISLATILDEIAGNPIPAS